MNNKLKGLLFGASILGGSMMMNGAHTAHADTWTANSVQQIEQQMKAQTKQGQKLVVYVVQRGDTLSGISVASKVPMKTIIDLNHITNANQLRVGQKINLGDSQQARDFVEAKGQSVTENAKGYQAPKPAVKADTKTAYKTAMVAQNNNGHTATAQNTQANGSVANNGGHAVNDAQANVGHIATPNPARDFHPKAQGMTGNQQTVNSQGHTTTSNNGQTTKPNPAKDFHSTAQGHSGNQGQANTGSQTTPNQPATGGNQGTATTPSKPNTGNQGNTKPSQPTKPVAPTAEKLNAEKVNKIYQDTMKTKYGWNGTWMNSKDGYDKAREFDEHGAMDKINGYADGVTWSGDKNPNKTLGEGEAKAMYDQWKPTNEGYKCYKYGYSKTTAHTDEKGRSVVHTDYYLWN